MCSVLFSIYILFIMKSYTKYTIKIKGKSKIVSSKNYSVSITNQLPTSRAVKEKSDQFVINTYQLLKLVLIISSSWSIEPAGQSINQSIFVKRHKSRANQRQASFCYWSSHHNAIVHRPTHTYSCWRHFKCDHYRKAMVRYKYKKLSWCWQQARRV